MTTPLVQIPLADLKSAARDIHAMVSKANPEERVALNSILNTLVRSTGLGNSHGELLHRAKTSPLILSGHIEQESKPVETPLRLYKRWNSAHEKVDYVISSTPLPKASGYQEVIFQASFEGKAWQNNYAIATDDNEVFDVTSHVLHMRYEDILRLEDDADARDKLIHTSTAPDLARNWQGPFDIYLRNFEEMDGYVHAAVNNRIFRLDQVTFQEKLPETTSLNKALLTIREIRTDIETKAKSMPLSEFLWKRHILNQCGSALEANDMKALISLINLARFTLQ